MKAGYKQTDVGLIPEDWEVKALKELDLDISDGNYSSKYPKSSEFQASGVPFIRANNVRNMSVVDDDLRFISESLHAELQKGHLKKNDILVTTRGDIGQIAFVPDRHIDSNINAQLVRINPSRSQLDHRFLGYILAFGTAQKQFENLQTGSALKQLPVGKLTSLEIPLPGTKGEQEAIAEALSDADALIVFLGQLLAKTRHLKQGAMQELLTGTKRVPGFSNAWEETEIGDLCRLEEGEVTEGGDTNYLEIGDVNISSKTYDISRKEKLSVPGSVKVPQGTLLISRVRPTRGAITITTEPTYISSAFCRLKFDNTFVFYIASQDRFLNYLGENSKGGTYPTCRAPDILGYSFLAPKAAEEQIAIAAILSDMDAEIAALEAKLAKAHQLKQGMMQELLTGRIRLV